MYPHSLPHPLEARTHPSCSSGWEGGQHEGRELHQSAHEGLGRLRVRAEGGRAGRASRLGQREVGLGVLAG